MRHKLPIKIKTGVTYGKWLLTDSTLSYLKTTADRNALNRSRLPVAVCRQLYVYRKRLTVCSGSTAKTKHKAKRRGESLQACAWLALSGQIAGKRGNNDYAPMRWTDSLSGVANAGKSDSETGKGLSLLKSEQHLTE